MLCGIHNTVLWAFRIFHPTAWHYVGLIIYITFVIPLVLIIQITSPKKSDFGVGNARQCAMLITFGWIMVDLSQFAEA
jgi:hypothetical protein